ncbi:hypothetical protein [Nocardioides limicola]|uniref:hypothetical protein n=1 Tax=Nocardioides limicola TaxID=2803368 RepID=UPI00193C6BCA|nr:hypothetical protein [Nocardioides sp. DJM-14]
MAGSGPCEKREILACAQAGVVARRQGDVDDLRRLLAWADVHSGDPQAEPGALAGGRGGPVLVTVGGEGTPGVNDLCFAEIAVARGAGVVATQNLTADALDLRHRLPRVWAGLQALRCEVWVGCRVARMSRQLSLKAVAIVDAAVAAALAESPSRILVIAEAKVIEADRVAHEERIAANRVRRGVWLSRPRPGDAVDEVESTAGVRSVVGRLDEAEAVEFFAAVEELAQALAVHGHYDVAPSMDQLRADAMGLLGRPAEALAFLDGIDEHPDERADADGKRASRPRGRAMIYVHLSADAVTGLSDSVARVEGFGPMLAGQVADLLGRRDVVVAPVIDLNQTHAVNGYEHPTVVKRRTELRTCGDVFPHSSSLPGVRVDHDHPVPYDGHGPPGQTGDHNDSPLTRRHHRAKTHLGYRLDQLGLGVYRWRTPHGLARVVTPRGTANVTLLTNTAGDIIGEQFMAD